MLDEWEVHSYMIILALHVICLFFMFSNLYWLHLYNKIYVALADLRQRINKKWIQNWTTLI